MYFIKTHPQYLKKEVKFFYSIKMNNVPNDFTLHRRLPDGTLDIVINLKKPIYISKDGKNFELMPHVSLTGLYTDKCILKYEDAVYVVGAVLQPGYAHLIVNDTLEHHRAATKNAVEVFGNKVYTLQEKMYNIRDEKEKHWLFEHFLIPHLRKPSNNYSVNNIVNAVASIHESSGVVSINNLCKKHFMSERNFRRKFIEYVGMSPKKYAAIIRIKAFCLFRQSGMNYNDCVDHLEFTDQSHLHKEFIKIVGINPENFFHPMNAISEKFLQFI